MTINAGAAPAPEDDEPDASSWFTRIAPRPAIALEPDVSLEPGTSLEPGISLVAAPEAAPAPDPAAAEPAPATPAGERSRVALAFTGPGLTWLGGVLLGCLVVGLGTASDLALGGGLGTVFTATFLLGCVLVALAVRIRALAVAVVLPPLLFAGGYGLETKTSGQTTGLRQMSLDVATSLALHAPLLFLGTAVAVAVALVRLAVHLIRR